MSQEQNLSQPSVAVMTGKVGIAMVFICLAFAWCCPFINLGGYSGTDVLTGDLFDWLTIPVVIFTLVLMSGFSVIAPKQALVLVRFGKFKGVLMENGFFWIPPWVGTTSVTLKIENYASDEIKVNDKTGSPIIVGAVVSCQVVDPAAFTFNADDTEDLIMNTIDRVLRSTVSQYAYDVKSTEKESDDEETCLRDDSEEITEKFKAALQKILSGIGVEVLDANFTNLSYAPEIAGVMLQRQQASAMMDARKMLVKLTVTVVKDAIKAMESTDEGQAAIKFDEKSKAELASNLLTVLVSERGAQVTLPLQ
jgi:regulator of protease activity HflC (stomatin/prohibitin superfamily)